MATQQEKNAVSPTLRLIGASPTGKHSTALKSACATCPGALWSCTGAGKVRAFCRPQHQDVYTSADHASFVEYCDGPFAMESDE